MAKTARLIILCLMSSAMTAAGAAPRPYTVDDMLATEAIGKARFDPSGDHLVFEHHGRFDKQADFSRQYAIGETRSKLYVADLTAKGAPRLLFDQRPDSGYTLASLSPDGAYAAYGIVSAKGNAAGVVSLSGRDNRQFGIVPEYSPAEDLPWLGQHRLAMEALPAGTAPMMLSTGREVFEEMAVRWNKRNEGHEPTSARIGSGRFASFPEPDAQLALADAETGSVRMIGNGRSTSWYPSGDRSALAVLREERLAIDPTKRIEHGANIGGVQHRLMIHDLTGGKDAAPADACTGCDVLNSSLNWSATAPLLSFYARDAGKDWADARFRVYDRRTGKTRVVDLGTLKPFISRAGLFMDARSAWIGDKLVVLATEDPAAEKPRADWYLVDGGKPRKLTASFSGATPEFFGLGADSLLLLHGGDAWSLGLDGKSVNLTDKVAEPVTAWREPSPYRMLPYYNAQPVRTAMLEARAADPAAARRLLFVDLASGKLAAIPVPKDGEIIAASPAARRAALVEKADNVSHLVVLGADGSRRELQTINAHLKDVVAGTPVRIDHKGPKGDARMSWLLLPPGYKPGTKLATVVNVYPGSVGRDTFHRWQLDDAHALNDQIMAGHGYAVLYPSLPVAYEKVPRDPLDGLVDEVFTAVDAAVAKGYVDPDRLAVQGQSYGGYTTGALIGLTDRFKSAVAQAGLYDLISSYGQFDIRQRIAHEKKGLDLFAVSLMETSQGGMGAPPWDDPQRYLRNSPLMHVKNIKTPVMLISGDLDYVSTTQSEEFFTALTRLNKDAVLVRYYGEDHVYNSPANIRDMWRRIFAWYEETLGPPTKP